MKVLRKNMGLVTNFEMCEILRQREFNEDDCNDQDQFDEEEENNNNNNNNNSQTKIFLEEHRKEKPLYPQPHDPFSTESDCYNTLLNNGIVGRQRKDDIKKFLSSVEPIDFTTAEVLMLVNLKPKTREEVKLIVEECEVRLTEEEVEDLLKLVQKFL
jgi:hypothetical protein